MATGTVRTISLPSGGNIPVLGQGTWHLAEHPHDWDAEVTSLRLGLDLGLRLIDTAEMYADGAAERLVAEAIAGRRDEVFLVSKVLPTHATRRQTIVACEKSLRRLRTDRIDLYLLHWRGSPPLAETVSAFAELLDSEKIVSWGVSNLDADDMRELVALDGGSHVQTDQVLYNLTRRGVERDLLPWCRTRGIPLMAYSPIEQGRLLEHPVLRRIAMEHSATPAQVALSWVLRDGGVSAIVKAATPSHLREDRAALDLVLGAEDVAALERAFPPPAGPEPLAML